MLHKVPKILAAASGIFVIGVLAYTMNDRFESLQGQVAEPPASSTPASKVCCVNTGSYYCTTSCTAPGVRVGITGVCDTGTNCKSSSFSSSSSSTAKGCCLNTGSYYCTTSCTAPGVRVGITGTCDTATNCKPPPPQTSSSSAAGAVYCCEEWGHIYIGGSIRYYCSADPCSGENVFSVFTASTEQSCSEQCTVWNQLFR